MSEATDRDVVRGILQHGYSDATQTRLDDRVAGAVLTGLRERGWVSLEEVAAIISAAGGEVVVTDAHLRHVFDHDLVLTVEDDFTSMGKRLRVRPA